MRSSARNALQEVLQGLPVSLWRLQARKELFQCEVRRAHLEDSQQQHSLASLDLHQLMKGYSAGGSVEDPRCHRSLLLQGARELDGPGQHAILLTEGCQGLPAEHPAAVRAHLARALGSGHWAPPQSKGPAQPLPHPAADPSRCEGALTLIKKECYQLKESSEIMG